MWGRSATFFGGTANRNVTRRITARSGLAQWEMTRDDISVMSSPIGSHSLFSGCYFAHPRSLSHPSLSVLLCTTELWRPLLLPPLERFVTPPQGFVNYHPELEPQMMMMALLEAWSLCRARCDPYPCSKTRLGTSWPRRECLTARWEKKKHFCRSTEIQQYQLYCCQQTHFSQIEHVHCRPGSLSAKVCPNNVL